MLKFDWNSLRIGDRVLVHDSEGAQLTLRPGVVAMIDARKGAKRAGVRFTGSDEQLGIRWPSYRTMHRDPRASNDQCWRCDEAVDAPSDTNPQVPDREWICGRCRQRRVGEADVGLVQPKGWTLCIACVSALPGFTQDPKSLR